MPNSLDVRAAAARPRERMIDTVHDGPASSHPGCQTVARCVMQRATGSIAATAPATARLLDAELLAQVYVELTGGRQIGLSNSQRTSGRLNGLVAVNARLRETNQRVRFRLAPMPPVPSKHGSEQAAFIAAVSRGDLARLSPLAWLPHAGPVSQLLTATRSKVHGHSRIGPPGRHRAKRCRVTQQDRLNGDCRKILFNTAISSSTVTLGNRAPPADFRCRCGDARDARAGAQGQRGSRRTLTPRSMLAAEKIDKQLRRYKRRLSDHSER